MSHTPRLERNKVDDTAQGIGLQKHTKLDPYFEGRADREIWNMFKDGHVGAFRYIYINYFNLIFAYGCRISRDQELVKDCIQELFIDLRKSESLSETNSIKFYLFRALRWKIYRKLSQLKKYQTLENLDSAFDVEIVESHENLLIKDQELDLDKRKLNAALANLTKRQKEAMYYYYNQNLNYNEVAEIMQLSNVKSARNIIYKAIDQLKKFF